MSIFTLRIILCSMVAVNLVGAYRAKHPRVRNLHFLVAGFGLGQIVTFIGIMSAMQ